MKAIMKANPELKQKREAFYDSVSDIHVGIPIVHGDVARVPTFYTQTQGSQSVKMRGEVYMLRRGGVWRMKGGSNRNETTNNWLDLVGKPISGNTIP